MMLVGSCCLCLMKFWFRLSCCGVIGSVSIGMS